MKTAETTHCPTCGQKFPTPYKPRPVCTCGAKRWTEVFNTDTKKITLECKKCGREVER